MGKPSFVWYVRAIQMPVLPAYGKGVPKMNGSGMMQFSTKSWHYKLMTMVHGASYFYRTHYLTGEIIAPKTIRLCPYCRVLVATILTLPFWALGGGLIRLLGHVIDNFPEIHLPNLQMPKFPTPERIRNLSKDDKSRITLTIYAGIMFTFAFLGYENSHKVSGDVILNSSIGLFALLGLPLIKWIVIYRKEHHTPKPKTPKTPKVKQPNLWWEMAKSKHYRICPIIQFVDPTIQEPLQ